MSVTLELTEAQVISLLEQLSPEARARVISRFGTAINNANQPAEKPRRVAGLAKQELIYMADDFNAPLDATVDVLTSAAGQWQLAAIYATGEVV